MEIPMPYDRKFFFDNVRRDLFKGTLTQSQVDGMEYILGIWERHYEEANPRDGTKWLAYALATFYHETAYTMNPIEEYGKGSGKSYGQATGPYGQKYYGRGHVQLTWEDNYKKGQQYLKDRYGVEANIHPEAHKMLHEETSALVSFDGMVYGWFTGVGLPKYFNATVEDPVNARRIVNGTDKASTIANYYWLFKKALKQVPKAETPKEEEAQLPDLPSEPAMPEPIPEEEHPKEEREHHVTVTRVGGGHKVT
jgi:putative chitinase